VVVGDQDLFEFLVQLAVVDGDLLYDLVVLPVQFDFEGLQNRTEVLPERLVLARLQLAHEVFDDVSDVIPQDLVQHFAVVVLFQSFAAVPQKTIHVNDFVEITIITFIIIIVLFFFPRNA